MSDYFVVGDVVTLDNEFAVDGVLTNPTTTTLTVTKPDGTAAVYTGGQLTNPSAGVFSKDVTTDQAGTWAYKWVGTGAAADVEDGTFDVWAAASAAQVVTLEQVRSALNLGDDTSHDEELRLYIAAITEHIEAQVGTLPSAEYTETVAVGRDGTLLTRHWPILAVDSVEDGYGTSYTTGFTIGNGAFSFEHDSLGAGVWTVTYTAGFAAIPADLKLAALEDIRGLYQPGQIGAPAAFGAFGIDSTDTGPTYRPVRQWPRVDAWVSSRYGPVIA